MLKILTRDKFREEVFKRDNHQCVVCKQPAIDAHHIVERRLFTAPPEYGGYFIENGASLCQQHHILAEQTIISPNELRQLANITKICLPEHLYNDNDYTYDKWGNIILPNQTRIKGELFYDESVQKILKEGNVLDSFQKYIKYPRTYHLPWSVLGKDDRQLQDDSNFQGKQVVVTIKMDGENTTMYNDYIHARSINSSSHPSRNRVKKIWSEICYLIDDNMRICGENLEAKHSIKYEYLPSYFEVFSIWIDDKCLSWNETVEYTKILGLINVPVLYQGIYDKEKIMYLFDWHLKNNKSEGYVIRLADEFTYRDFRKSIAKYVHPEFRQTLNDSHGHWMSKKIEYNQLLK